mmetsp:Transcript_2940/g.11985  ORF Transcript_2940/g.11985 Transcript_2940/m.11985 type:complete len:204 (-) Transcript_2940:283-894(-)
MHPLWARRKLLRVRSRPPPRRSLPTRSPPLRTPTPTKPRPPPTPRPCPPASSSASAGWTLPRASWDRRCCGEWPCSARAARCATPPSCAPATAHATACSRMQASARGGTGRATVASPPQARPPEPQLQRRPALEPRSTRASRRRRRPLRSRTPWAALVQTRLRGPAPVAPSRRQACPPGPLPPARRLAQRTATACPLASTPMP